MQTRAVLASQSELVRLQSFLDAQLPETCEVHSQTIEPYDYLHLKNTEVEHFLG